MRVSTSTRSSFVQQIHSTPTIPPNGRSINSRKGGGEPGVNMYKGSVVAGMDNRDAEALRGMVPRGFPMFMCCCFELSRRLSPPHGTSRRPCLPRSSLEKVGTSWTSTSPHCNTISSLSYTATAGLLCPLHLNRQCQQRTLTLTTVCRRQSLRPRSTPRGEKQDAPSKQASSLHTEASSSPATTHARLHVS